MKKDLELDKEHLRVLSLSKKSTSLRIGKKQGEQFQQKSCVLFPHALLHPVHPDKALRKLVVKDLITSIDVILLYFFSTYLN